MKKFGLSKANHGIKWPKQACGNGLKERLVIEGVGVGGRIFASAGRHKKRKTEQ